MLFFTLPLASSPQPSQSVPFALVHLLLRLVQRRHALLDVRNGLARVEVLRARLAAVHDGVTPVELEGVVQLLEALLGDGVAAVLDPPEGLHEHGRPEVGVRVPPVARAGGGAARAEDALVHAVELLAVLARLQVLAGALVRLERLRALRLVQPRLDGAVLVVEVGEVRHEVLDDVHVRQRVNLGRLRRPVDVAQAGERVPAVDVHRAAAADALAAAPPEGQARVLLVLDLQQCVEYHGPAVVQVNRVRHHVRFLLLLRVPPVDLEVLQVRPGVAALELEALGRQRTRLRGGACG
mmetsp:Transcript_36413/g.114130  ORF Transcript_36413/g.114130 Transcript_36413/m.114130 type:complete len:295 (-) Transcript_36413:144-1028(-)